MSNVTNLQDARIMRASGGRQPARSAALAASLEVLHLHLAELCEALSGQLDAVEGMLGHVADPASADNFVEALHMIRRGLVETDRLRGQERADFDAWRRQSAGVDRS